MKASIFLSGIYNKLAAIDTKIKSIFRNILLVLLLCTPLITCHYVTRYIDDEFDSMAQQRTESIALSLEVAEREMERTLNVAAETVKAKILLNPRLKASDLVDLSSKTGITTISLLNASDGKFFLTSGRSFDPNNKFYKELSLLDVEQCSNQICNAKPCRTEHEAMNCKIKRTEVIKSLGKPNVPFSLPMIRVTLHSDNPVKAAAKWVVEYDGASDKIIDLFYANQDLSYMLERNVEIYKGYLEYIKLSDSNGNLIMDAGKQSSGKRILRKSVELSPKWSFVLDGKTVQYSYVLTAEISTSRRDTRLFIVRTLFTIIEIAIILLIFTTMIMLRKPEQI